MIFFKRISYKNFLSTGNIPIEIDLSRSQTTLIVGVNGSGKSTLLDALCFVLFNRPFRIIKKEQMINTINNADCLVEVEFDVGTKNYIIRRGIRPNLFEIFCNGKMINQDANNIDYQKYLEQNIMKLNYRSFIQVVMLGSSSYEPFMKMKPRYRREVVEEILDIRVFGLMDLILRSQQSDLQKKLTEVRHQCELIKSRYETEAKYLKSLQAQDIDEESKQKERLKTNEQNRLEYDKKLITINEAIAVSQNQLQHKDKTEKQLRQLEKIESKIDQNLDNHNKSLKFFVDNDTCPVCTQPINKKFKEHKVEEEHQKCAKLEKGIKELLTEITKQEKKITGFNKISEKINEQQIEVAKISSSLTALKEHSDQIHEEMKNKNIGEIDIEKMAVELENIKGDIRILLLHPNGKHTKMRASALGTTLDEYKNEIEIQGGTMFEEAELKEDLDKKKSSKKLVIRKGVKINSHSVIYEDGEIGENSIIGHRVLIREKTRIENSKCRRLLQT